MQTTWKVFTQLNEALSNTRGNTQISIGLVRDNFSSEKQLSGLLRPP